MSQAGRLNTVAVTPGDVATAYITNAGTAVPAVNILNVLGGTGITTSGAGNTITITNTGGGGVETFNVDDGGSVTGGTLQLYGNTGSANAGSSVKFIASSATEIDLQTTDLNGNTMIGGGSGNATISGIGNTALGTSSGIALTSGGNNTAIGYTALNGSLSDSNNTCVGYNTLNLTNGGGDNTAIGHISMQANITGSNNTAVGSATLATATGTGNVAIGFSSGINYGGSESNNTLINAGGTGAESNVIRIADTTAISPATSCFIGGINNVDSSGFTSPLAVFVDSANGQLGFGSGGGGGITTIDGDTGSITGSTVTIFANLAGNNCGATVSFVNSGTTSTLNVSDFNVNTIVGLNSGNANLIADGQNNTIFGSTVAALLDNSSFNTFIGSNISTSASSASNGVWIGDNVGGGGDKNTIIGSATGGAYVGTETSNVLLGYRVSGIANESNVIRIADSTSISPATTCFIGGIFGVTTSDAGSSTAVLIDNTGNLGTVPSSIRFKENVQDMGNASEIIYKLRPVTFNYIKDASKTIQTGLIAEEVMSVDPRLAVMNKGQADSVKYHELPALLLNEIQKLNKRIATLESK